MFKFIIKILLVLVIGFGIYFYFNQPDLFSFLNNQESIDIPEVSYQDLVHGADQVIEQVYNAKDTAQDILEVAEDVVEIVEDVDNIFDGDINNESELQEDFQLAVPFTSQAPYADWNLPYQEACEEASAFMVSMYFNGEPSGSIDPAIANAEILEIVDFQNTLYGYYLDTTTMETARMIDDFYGFHAFVVEDPTINQIKSEIASGRPVIVPLAGKQLGNPFFSGEGPLYHMLVIKGYTADKFITNDPGTKHGDGYIYDISVIMNAMGDWNDGDPANGAKRVIFSSINGVVAQ